MEAHSSKAKLLVIKQGLCLLSRLIKPVVLVQSPSAIMPMPPSTPELLKPSFCDPREGLLSFRKIWVWQIIEPNFCASA